MKRIQAIAVLMASVMACCSLAGCLNAEEPDERPGFEWENRSQPDCNPVDINITCKEYLSGLTTPTNSLHHPTEDEIWISDLNGRIVAFNGQNTREVGNISELISNCFWALRLYLITRRALRFYSPTSVQRIVKPKK